MTKGQLPAEDHAQILAYHGKFSADVSAGDTTQDNLNYLKTTQMILKGNLGNILIIWSRSAFSG